ncbi:MAG: hypothetical protein JSU72_04310 [Deltaproteobacteria bacterium]|nr:MAG: hypothetical protein JSU72_04310 [Deltaproteobacteria bacterium]
MKKLLALIMVCLVFGCAAPKISLPDSPQYETSRGRDCAMKCQSNYVDCLRAWQYSETCLGFGAIPSARVDDCRQLLGECYQFCSEEDKQ